MEQLLLMGIFISVSGSTVLSQSQSQIHICYREPDICVDRSKINCENDQYRKIDGSCNNPISQTIGMARTTYRRLLRARYSDENSAPAVAISGNQLPSPRLLSFEIFGRLSINDPDFTLLSMQWGQIVAHDTSLRAIPGDPWLRPLEAEQQTCCDSFGQYETRTIPAKCLPMDIPQSDPYFHNYQCLPFIRSVTDKDQQCPGWEYSGPVNQLSGATHFIDLSFVYGNSDEESQNLRTLVDGLLRTNDKQQKWPPRAGSPQKFCPLGDPGAICYQFGDPRGNQSPSLAALQIVLLREHNRLARNLAAINPHWNDETLFEEARRINIAQFQHITYYEWNVNIYGYQRMLENGLIYETLPGQYVDDYDVCVDPRSIQAFQHSSFRYFHNQVQGIIHLMTESRNISNDSIRLLDFIDKPGSLESECLYSSFIRGLSTQAASRSDRNFDFAVAEGFITAGSVRMQELRAFDLQRDREHGIASYNDYREFCGLKRAKRWNDYSDFISFADITKLRRLYESHEDVDLSIGGSLEKHLPEALVGPTFMCINLLQYRNLRTGDRYFYENVQQPYPFTPEQLVEIRKASAARLICDNGNVKNMQKFAFRKLSVSNMLLECSDIPEIDLQMWLD